MAIKLEVQPYCEDCPIFEADVEQAKKIYGDDRRFDDFYITDTYVRCSRRSLCAGLKRYLEKELQKGELNATE